MHIGYLNIITPHAHGIIGFIRPAGTYCFGGKVILAPQVLGFALSRWRDGLHLLIGGGTDTERVANPYLTETSVISYRGRSELFLTLERCLRWWHWVCEIEDSVANFQSTQLLKEESSDLPLLEITDDSINYGANLKNWGIYPTLSLFFLFFLSESEEFMAARQQLEGTVDLVLWARILLQSAIFSFYYTFHCTLCCDKCEQMWLGTSWNYRHGKKDGPQVTWTRPRGQDKGSCNLGPAIFTIPLVSRCYQ